MSFNRYPRRHRSGAASYKPATQVDDYPLTEEEYVGIQYNVAEAFHYGCIQGMTYDRLSKRQKDCLHELYPGVYDTERARGSVEDKTSNAAQDIGSHNIGVTFPANNDPRNEIKNPHTQMSPPRKSRISAINDEIRQRTREQEARTLSDDLEPGEILDEADIWLENLGKDLAGTSHKRKASNKERSHAISGSICGSPSTRQTDASTAARADKAAGVLKDARPSRETLEESHGPAIDDHSVRPASPGDGWARKEQRNKRRKEYRRQGGPTAYHKLTGSEQRTERADTRRSASPRGTCDEKSLRLREAPALSRGPAPYYRRHR
ncbi:MAG: hypothetical protein Q9174_001201 [Haloplaca sp. 1 TL-2023]